MPAEDPAVIPTRTAVPRVPDDAIRQQVERLVAESVFRRWPLSASLPERRSPAVTAPLPAAAGGEG